MRSHLQILGCDFSVSPLSLEEHRFRAEIVSTVRSESLSSYAAVFGRCVPFNQVKSEGKTNLSCKREKKSTVRRITIYGRKPVRHSSHYRTAGPVYSGMCDGLQIKIHYKTQHLYSVMLKKEGGKNTLGI